MTALPGDPPAAQAQEQRKHNDLRDPGSGTASALAPCVMTARDRSTSIEPAHVHFVDGVLDPSTCRSLISRVEDDRWLTTTADLRRPANGPHLAVPHRRGEPESPCRLLGFDEPPRFAIVDDPVLALRIFYRIAPLLPETIDGAQLAGLKPLLRCVRLSAGEGTEAHHDPARECSAGMHSHLSVMVFLNEDFAGGGVEFPTLRQTIAAKAGRALVFPHGLLHRDALIERGDAFLLHAEVFYADAWQPMR
jgi:hypothetical protein